MTHLRAPFQVYSFDTDAFGSLTAPRLLGYLLEVAGRSADELGFGIGELRRQGLTWVLGRIGIEIDGPLWMGDRVEVETWPSGLERMIATREFRWFRDSVEVGRATSLWFVLDIQTRTPVSPHPLFPETLQSREEHLVALSRSIDRIAESADIERRFCVRRADIDLNQHVTAASYVAWAMEAVPEDMVRRQTLQFIDIQYLEECLAGSTVISGSRVMAPGAIVHRISRHQDDKDLARMRTVWTRRDGQ